jgi:hypothetical protein
MMDFYIDVPTPFKKGDILSYRDMILALDYAYNSDPALNDRHLRSGDTTDMCAMAYYMSDGLRRI